MAQKKDTHATLEQKNNGSENLCPAALTPQSCRYRVVLSCMADVHTVTVLASTSSSSTRRSCEANSNISERPYDETNCNDCFFPRLLFLSTLFPPVSYPCII